MRGESSNGRGACRRSRSDCGVFSELCGAYQAFCDVDVRPAADVCSEALRSLWAKAQGASVRTVVGAMWRMCAARAVKGAMGHRRK